MKKEALEVADLRKQHHLDLTNSSQVAQQDARFYYEPLMESNELKELPAFDFAGKQMQFPLWISSMTGGTAKAGPINKILAKAAAHFGLGMGLGSCRIILDDDQYFEDFNLRPILGPNVPLFANIGIAQLEQLIQSDKLHLLNQLVEKLDADGIFLHINPLQELMQPEGDIYTMNPLDALDILIENFKYKIIVKEVGQGMGPNSLRSLLDRDIYGIDFASHGGTNFAKMEMLRSTASDQEVFASIAHVGHSADEMVGYLNEILKENNPTHLAKHIIISGGVGNFMDGYYLTQKCQAKSVYGQASVLLNKANEGEEALFQYLEDQIRGFKIAQKFLKVKNS